MDYTLTVGLEVHAELKTKTKMFCSSCNNTEEKNPNTNICPVCLGYPGSLPVINKEAVRHVLRLGIAVEGALADYTEFDRKNYFYPDIPKGYQISQYAHPLVRGGKLAGVELTRVHLEEDTAKSTHDTGNKSLVDFNRAGVPLMELVTEPVIHDAATAVNFAKELQLMLRTLGLSDANMEKGEMRVEANISVSPSGTRGTKVEVKNLNSFKAVEKAIEYERERHIKLLQDGDKITQETRGWDEDAQKTFSQRVKEESHDYRYFPDPDLPKLFISEIPEFSIDALKRTLPELPQDKRARLLDLGLKQDDIEIYVNNPLWSNYFEAVSESLSPTLIQLASNYILTDLEDVNIPPKNFAAVITMIDRDELSARGAKDLLKMLSKSGGNPKEVAETHGLIQKNDSQELEKVAQDIINTHEEVAEEYRAGKEASLQFLIGQGMKATKGSANPQTLKEVFMKLLK